jgi:hypothetical protein
MRQVTAPIGRRRLVPSCQDPGRTRRKPAAATIQQIPVRSYGKLMPYPIERPMIGINSHLWDFNSPRRRTLGGSADHADLSVGCSDESSAFANSACCKSGAIGHRVVLYSHESVGRAYAERTQGQQSGQTPTTDEECFESRAAASKEALGQGIFVGQSPGCEG